MSAHHERLTGNEHKTASAEHATLRSTTSRGKRRSACLPSRLLSARISAAASMLAEPAIQYCCKAKSTCCRLAVRCAISMDVSSKPMGGEYPFWPAYGASGSWKSRRISAGCILKMGGGWQFGGEFSELIVKLWPGHRFQGPKAVMGTTGRLRRTRNSKE